MTVQSPHTVTIAGAIVCRVVGLGGIGQVVATYLTRFLAGLGRPARVLLIDGDEYEPGNETRMSVPIEHENKAVALQQELAATCPSPHVTLLAVPEFVRADNLDRLFRSGPSESVLLCVDNHATRKLVSDYAAGLDDICLVSGGNDGVGPHGSGKNRKMLRGTAGNVHVCLRAGGRALSPTLTDVHPEIADPPDDHPDSVGCGAMAASVPQILFTNLHAASLMLNTWWLWACDALAWAELNFNIEKGRAAPVLPLAPIEDAFDEPVSR